MNFSPVILITLPIIQAPFIVLNHILRQQNVYENMVESRQPKTEPQKLVTGDRPWSKKQWRNQWSK